MLFGKFLPFLALEDILLTNWVCNISFSGGQGLGQLESWRWSGRFEREQRSMLTLTLPRHLSAPFQLCIYSRVIADIVDGI